DRGAFAAAQAALVTELPVFRAHLTDSRLTADAATLQVLADEYRRQLESAFCIVTGKSAAWTAASGWPGDERRSPPIDRMIAAAATTGKPQRGLAAIGEKMFIVVSQPARFAEETLGTLSVGYPLDDVVARRLAEVTQADVTIVAGTRVAASSLTG